MKLPIIQARLRIKINGPPLSIFDPRDVRRYWIQQGHEVAQTLKEKKLVIDRIRKLDAENTPPKFSNNHFCGQFVRTNRQTSSIVYQNSTEREIIVNKKTYQN